MVALPVELSSLTRTKDAFVSRDWQRTYLQVVLFFWSIIWRFFHDVLQIRFPLNSHQNDAANQNQPKYIMTDVNKVFESGPQPNRDAYNHYSSGTQPNESFSIYFCGLLSTSYINVVGCSVP